MNIIIEVFHGILLLRRKVTSLIEDIKSIEEEKTMLFGKIQFHHLLHSDSKEVTNSFKVNTSTFEMSYKSYRAKWKKSLERQLEKISSFSLT